MRQACLHAQDHCLFQRGTRVKPRRRKGPRDQHEHVRGKTIGRDRRLHRSAGLQKACARRGVSAIAGDAQVAKRPFQQKTAGFDDAIRRPLLCGLGN
jgi:hypothetical protein